MRKRVALSSSAVACAALVLTACGEPLASLPPDTVAAVYLEPPAALGSGGFASVRLDSASCFQLDSGTEATLNGTPADEVYVGGRGGNPLAAYIDVGCSPPSASWFLTDPVAPPFVLALSSGGVTLEVELDEDLAIARCDFPSCFSESPARPPEQP